jgi:hypothetical protein
MRYDLTSDLLTLSIQIRDVNYISMLIDFQSERLKCLFNHVVSPFADSHLFELTTSVLVDSSKFVFRIQDCPQLGVQAIWLRGRNKRHDSREEFLACRHKHVAEYIFSLYVKNLKILEQLIYDFCKKSEYLSKIELKLECIT